MQAPPTPNTDFWYINFGHILTMFSLLCAFWSAHQANVKRIEKDAEDRKEIKTKLDLIFGWFQNNIIGRPHRPNEGD